MAWPKKQPVLDDEAAEAAAAGPGGAMPPAPKPAPRVSPKPKGKRPIPGAGQAGWKKIAQQMEK